MLDHEPLKAPENSDNIKWKIQVTLSENPMYFYLNFQVRITSIFHVNVTSGLT